MHGENNCWEEEEGLLFCFAPTSKSDVVLSGDRESVAAADKSS